MVSGLHVIAPEIPPLLAVAALIPDVLIAASAIILLLGGVFMGDKGANRILTLSIGVLGALVVMMLLSGFTHPRMELFSSLIVTDDYSWFVKLLMLVATLMVLMLSYGWLAKPDNQRIEFPVLILFALLGMMLMVSANDLISLYLGLELSSLPLYVLAAIKRDEEKPAEAGLKYFILGSLASGMLLFGASLVYGFAGTTSFDGLAQLFRASHTASGGVVMGLVLLCVALAFKVSAAPFHMWTPDVYEGAPTPVTAFFSIGPKVAAIALFARLMVQPFGGLTEQWQQIIVVISVASMVVGALGALMQSNIKRLLAYGSIGHAGYALMGLAAGTPDGIASIFIYFALYMVASAGTFACVMMMSRGGKPVEAISELSGLSRTRPRMAFALAVFMFSMAGIPPLAGFFSKLYVFLAALHAGLTGLAVIGVLASVVACYYYLRIVKVMYFDDPAPEFDAKVPVSTQYVLVFGTAVTLFFFILPTSLIMQAQHAAEALFK